MNQLTPSVRGALWMLGAVLSFTAMAIAVRELQRHMGSFEIVFLRSLVMLTIVLAMLPRAGIASVSHRRRFPLHLWRNVIHFCGQVLWVYSIGALTLATVFAIEFTMPVWTAMLAVALPQGEAHLSAAGACWRSGWSACSSSCDPARAASTRRRSP